jgi:hypothetical protein
MSWHKIHEAIIAPIYHVIFIGYIVTQYALPVLIPLVLSFSTYALLPYLDNDFTNSWARPSISAAIALIVIWLLRKSSGERNAIRRVADEISRCVEEHIRFKASVDETLRSRMAKASKEKMVAEAATHHTINLCSRIAEIFEIMTGQPCHSTFKTLDGERVITRGRDALIHNNSRDQVDEDLDAYDYRENTAFEEILTLLVAVVNFSV